MNVPMQDDDRNPYKDGYKSPYDKKKKWYKKEPYIWQFKKIEWSKNGIRTDS